METGDQKLEKTNYLKKLILLLLISNFSLLISSCGFKPMYGNGALSDPNSQLQSIAIANIPDRNGQMLRNTLIDRLQAGGQTAPTKYRLEITDLKETIRDLDITIRSDTTREQMKLSAMMKLVDVTTGEAIVQKDLSARGSYNILESEYTSRISRQDLRRDLIEKLAHQAERYITMELAQ